MHILENTDRWMVAFFQEGDSISVMDKPTEKIYNFDGKLCERFLQSLNHVITSRTHPGSMHYNLSLNDSIDYVVNELTKKGN